jgi:hypothetical protein
MSEEKTEVTIQDLADVQNSLDVVIALFGATAEFKQELNKIWMDIREEVQKHYTPEEGMNLPTDTVLPASINEHYFKLKSYLSTPE